MNYCGIELGTAVIGVQTVLFLFNVGELSIAESEDSDVVKENVGETLESCQEFFFGLGRIAIAPAVLLVGPADSAVFTYEEGSLSIVVLTVVAKTVGPGTEFVEVGEVFCKLNGILFVVVYVVNVGLFNVEVTGGIDAGTSGVCRLGCSVNQVENIVPLLSAPISQVSLKGHQPMIAGWLKSRSTSSSHSGRIP